MATNPHLRVVLCTEHDIALATSIEDAAFGVNPISAILFPGPRGENLQSRIDDTIKSWRETGTTHWLKVVDSSSNEPDQGFAFAKYNVFSSGQPKPTPFKLPPHANVELCRHAFDKIGEARWKAFGGTIPFVHLGVLVCHPDHWGKGAGRMLIEWGKDKARQLRIPMWLESSVQGYNTYRKCGFEVVSEHRTDLDGYMTAEEQARVAPGFVNRQMIWEPEGVNVGLPRIETEYGPNMFRRAITKDNDVVSRRTLSSEEVKIAA